MQRDGAEGTAETFQHQEWFGDQRSQMETFWTPAVPQKRTTLEEILLFAGTSVWLASKIKQNGWDYKERGSNQKEEKSS